MKKTKDFMVSYLENGVRRKFIVTATHKDQALVHAERLGAIANVKKAVSELSKDFKTF